jgi:NAD(P)-dependent dehydrogenase (short-subunit alcohol dehydrogenase family)
VVKGTVLVVGVGAQAGLGAASARRFSNRGYRVVVSGRTDERLQAVVGALRDAGGEAVAVVADASRESDVVSLLERADSAEDLQAVIFNVGNNAMAPALETSAEMFEALWRQNALGGFLVGREAARHMLPRGRGSILFTGATASLRARPPFTAFAAAKSALRAIAQGLAREFGPKGIHIAHVIVDGVIDGDFAREKFPEFFRAKGVDGLLDPDAIASAFLALHEQPACAWTHELDLRPFKEGF